MASALQVEKRGYILTGFEKPSKLKTTAIAAALILGLGMAMAAAYRMSPCVQATLSKGVPMWSLPLSMVAAALFTRIVIAKRNQNVVLFACDPILSDIRKLLAIQAKLQLNLQNRVNGEGKPYLKPESRNRVSQDEYMANSALILPSEEEYKPGEERILLLEEEQLTYVRLMMKLCQHHASLVHAVNQRNAKTTFFLSSQKDIYDSLMSLITVSEYSYNKIQRDCVHTDAMQALFAEMTQERDPVRQGLYRENLPFLPPPAEAVVQRKYYVKQIPIVAAIIIALGTILVLSITSTKVQTFFAKKIALYTDLLAMTATASLVLFMQKKPLLSFHPLMKKDFEKARLGHEFAAALEKVQADVDPMSDEAVVRCFQKLLLCEVQRRMMLADTAQPIDGDFRVDLHDAASMQRFSYHLSDKAFMAPSNDALDEQCTQIQRTYMQPRAIICENEKRLLTNEIRALFDNIRLDYKKYYNYFPYLFPQGPFGAS